MICDELIDVRILACFPRESSLDLGKLPLSCPQAVSVTSPCGRRAQTSIAKHGH
jgi:hypothetical protein